MSRLSFSALDRGGAPRLAGFYAAIFLVGGIQLPFWPVWLAGRGFGPEEIATLFAAAIWTKVLVTPAVGALTDRIGRRRGIMALLAGLAVLAYGGLSQACGFAAVLLLNLVAGAAQSALMPLGDSVTLAAVRNHGLDYGRIRLWGSITFILAAMGSGAALAGGGGTAADPDLILGLVFGASLLLCLACLAIPSAPAGSETGRQRWGALARLAGDRRFWLFAATASALQASHQLYYGFGTLYWQSLGFSDVAIGCLWAEGVVAEIVLFWYGSRLVAGLGPLGLLALGGAAGVLRWSLTGIVPGLAAAAGLQALHAFTFGASHLGAMHFLARTVPAAAAASAQALYAAASAGFGSGLVMLGAGFVYARYGGAGYLFMAGLSSLGLIGLGLLARRR